MSPTPTELSIDDPTRVGSGGGVAACLTTFVLGSIAQGAPFVLVAAELERRGVGTSWLAAVAAVRLAPYLLCSPVAGALAGRYDTRTVFAVTGLARGALIAALWIALRTGSPALVLVSLLFVLVAVGTPTFPALMRAVRHRTPHARLDRTSALAAGLESAAFVAGPALGGLLLLVDATDSLLVCAAMMSMSAAIASFLESAEVVNRPIEGRSRRVVRDAGRCLLGPGIRPAIVAVVGVNVLSGLMATLLVRIPAGLDFGRRTRLRTAFVRFRGWCVRRVHCPPPTHPAGAAARPAHHRRRGSRRARRDEHAARGADGVLRAGRLGSRR